MDIETLLDKLKIAHSGCESHEQIGFFKESIKEIIDAIESLKCCGNCEHYDVDNPKCEGCFDILGLPNWEQEK